MSAILVLLLIVLLVRFWYSAQHCRDLAIAAARDACTHQGLQFLDGSAALRRLRPGFSRSEGPYLSRTYNFEYSTDGFARRSGCVLLRNGRVTTVLLDD
jgi:hypothetical protein